jgi:two-component sensor histidine kinase
MVRIAWSVRADDGASAGASASDGAERFHFQWRESGGPPVAPPQRAGFGTRMIERLLASEIDGKTDLAYDVDGVTCTIDAPLRGLLDEITDDVRDTIPDTAVSTPAVVASGRDRPVLAEG